MKKTFFVCLFFCVALIGSLHAQIVSIPDANFKAALIAFGVDTNADGEIQVTEAEAVTALNVSTSNISDLTGIDSFTNVTILFCSYNNLTSLNLNNLTNLTEVVCQHNSLINLEVNALTGLTYLYCSYNQLASLDVSNLTNLSNLICSENQITSLDVTNLINLNVLDCEDNKLTSLDVSNLTNLYGLACDLNQLTTLDVSNSINLNNLHCTNNLLTSLDVSNLTFLASLECSANSLTNLDVSDLISLTSLDCRDNQLLSLEVMNLTNLQMLFCQSNSLTHLDLTYNENLQYLYLQNNNINSFLIKNGINESVLFYNNPNLQYICADTSEFIYLQQEMASYSITNVYLNSLCTYIPGGNYNSVSGKTIYDGNMNGCTVTDSTYPFLFIDINGVGTDIICSNQGGNYISFLDSGNYTFTPNLENPVYFSVSPVSPSVYFANNNNNVQMQDFCIVPNGVFPDVEIALSPTIQAVPGFDAEYLLSFHNKGTTTISGDIIVDFLGNKMTFVSASQIPSAQTSNQLTWSYTNLQPFESRSIAFTLNMLPPPTNNIGDTLVFSAIILLLNDANNADNYLTFPQEMVGAFDPNDKTCLEGNLVNNDKIGEYLHYFIRFQNTGTFPADHVVVVDTIDINKYEITSLQILETSHNAHIDINNGVLQFYFENIQLPDSFSNEPASHGYVLFKLKTKANLPMNSSVSNKAEIYFDYNAPVLTNTETTTFAANVGIANALQSPHFQAYPNPAQNFLTIETEKPSDFIILNIMGEKVASKYIQGQEKWDISGLATGIYWIKEVNANQGQTFVKE